MTVFWQKTILKGLSRPSKGTGYIRCCPASSRLPKRAARSPGWKIELYKQFFSEIIAEGESGIKGGNQFLDFIRFDIDIRNIKTLFRLRMDTFEEDAREMDIAGGVLSSAEFANLNTIQDQNEFIDLLKTKIRNTLLITLLDELKSEKAIRDVETRLTRVQLEQMERLSKRNPFSIHPILVYLEMKKYEVFNLRALARGKESKLSVGKDSRISGGVNGDCSHWQ